MSLRVWTCKSCCLLSRWLNDVNDNVMRERIIMDDDGDDDDCGYLPKRQDRREREALMPALPCLRPNGSSLLDDREGRK